MLIDLSLSWLQPAFGQLLEIIRADGLGALGIISIRSLGRRALPLRLLVQLRRGHHFPSNLSASNGQTTNIGSDA